MTSARLSAARVLVSLDRGRTTLSAEVERERPELADRRDQALFLELATGTTRWRAEVDALVAPYCRRALDDLTPEVRTVLRLAAYQLHHLDRIPAHAIVNESVELSRALRQERAAGFVNGVLRSLVRGRSQPSPLPARPADPADTDAALNYLSVTLSHPRWLVARWLTRVGFDACERWCQFNNATPEVTVRSIDPDAGDLLDRLRGEGVDATEGRYVPGSVQLAAGALGGVSPSMRQSLLIQDEASQLVGWLAAPPPGARMLDACAAPGGKTVLLARAAGPEGMVVAADRRAARVALLRATLARAGLTSRAPVLTLDAEVGLPFGPAFDRVLLDAPCSGLGTLRRDPDIKWSRRAEDLPALAASQQRMLAGAADVVRPGGAIVYATCSSEPEENDAIVNAFLAASPSFQLAPFATGALREGAAGVVDDRGLLRTLPFAHGLDAFFAALLVRRDTA